MQVKNKGTLNDLHFLFYQYFHIYNHNQICCERYKDNRRYLIVRKPNNGLNIEIMMDEKSIIYL